MPAFALILAAAALAGDDSWEPTHEAAAACYNRGVDALTEGDPVTAEQHFRKSLRKDPGCGMCSNALASSLLRQDRPAEAAEVAAALHERFPAEPEPAINLADATFAAERFEDSIAVSEQLLLANPDNWAGLQRLVRGLIRVGDTTRAKAALQQATVHHSSERIACELGKIAVEEDQLGLAERLLERCRQSGEAAAADALASRIHLLGGRSGEANTAIPADVDARSLAVFEAQGMMEAGDYKAAVTMLRRQRQAGQRYPETALLLGLCEYELGNVEEAIEALQEVYEAETWISVGRQGMMFGVLTAKAELAYKENIRLGVARLVQLQVEVGRLDDALATFAHAQAQLGPSGELAAAQVSLLAAQGQPAEAAAVAVSGLEQWPDSTLLLSTATWLATSLPEARSPELDLALAGTGEWRSIYNGAAERFNAGDAAGCVQHIEQAPGFADPEVTATFAQLAHSCATTGADLEAAERWLERAGGAMGVSAGARYNHAVLLARVGQDDAALALLALAAPSEDDPELLQQHRSLVVDIHVGRDDLDAALGALESGPIDALSRFNVGIMLYNAQRQDEALPLLRAACPGITVASEQARCEALVDGLEGGD